MNEPRLLFLFVVVAVAECFFRCRIVAEIFERDAFSINQVRILLWNGGLGPPAGLLDESPCRLPNVGLASHFPTDAADATTTITSSPDARDKIHRPFRHRRPKGLLGLLDFVARLEGMFDRF